jgi:hypothetical protein
MRLIQINYQKMNLPHEKVVTEIRHSVIENKYISQLNLFSYLLGEDLRILGKLLFCRYPIHAPTRLS